MHEASNRREQRHVPMMKTLCFGCFYLHVGPCKIDRKELEIHISTDMGQRQHAESMIKEWRMNGGCVERLF